MSRGKPSSTSVSPHRKSEIGTAVADGELTCGDRDDRPASASLTFELAAAAPSLPSRYAGLASENLYADGFLDLRLKDDVIGTGTLVCYYPAD